MTILELLESRSKWVKGYYAFTENECMVDANDPAACCWCLDGSVMKCYPVNDWKEIRTKLETVIRERFPDRTGLTGNDIATFNDSRYTTYEDVLSVVKEAGV